MTRIQILVICVLKISIFYHLSASSLTTISKCDNLWHGFILAIATTTQIIPLRCWTSMSVWRFLFIVLSVLFLSLIFCSVEIGGSKYFNFFPANQKTLANWNSYPIFTQKSLFRSSPGPPPDRLFKTNSWQNMFDIFTVHKFCMQNEPTINKICGK